MGIVSQPPNHHYVLGYIIETGTANHLLVKLVNDQSVEIKSLVPDYSVDVKDREILISANY